MTYGWAILIIALVLGVLYSLGIMNPKNFIPRAPPGSCFVFRPNGPGTTDFISLQGTCGYLPMYVASFNGVNAYVSVSRSWSYKSSNLDQSSWICWFRMSNLPQSGYYYKVCGSDTHEMSIYVGSSGTVGFRHQSNTYISSGYTARSGVWIFAGVSVKYLNATQIQYTLLVNGYIKNGTLNSNSLNIDRIYSGYHIGSNAIWQGVFFNGSIANVQIYNTALTPQEIQYLYQQGLGGGPVRLQNLVAWWPLNGDAKDYSGNNNHGTIYEE